MVAAGSVDRLGRSLTDLLALTPWSLEFMPAYEFAKIGENSKRGFAPFCNLRTRQPFQRTSAIERKSDFEGERSVDGRLISGLGVKLSNDCPCRPHVL
jgi:hypothetical protein